MKTLSDNPKLKFISFLAIIVFMSILLFIGGEYYAYLIRLMSIYAIVAMGLNTFMGYCGQINFGMAGFFCIGAYGSGMLQAKLGWNFLAAAPVAMVLTFLVAWGISFPLLRLRGHAMAIGTVSFAGAIYLVADRFPSLTGGSDGICLPSITLFGHTMGAMFYNYFILAFTVAAFVLCYFLVNSPVGQAMKAVRDDEVAASAMGLNVHYYKVVAWMVNGVYGGLAGALYAQQAGFLGPSTFGLMLNVTFLLMILVGGVGTTLGPLVGSVIMTLLTFLLVTVEQYTCLSYGLVLFLVLRFMPDGVVGIITRKLKTRASQKKRRITVTRFFMANSAINKKG